MFLCRRICVCSCLNVSTTTYLSITKHLFTAAVFEDHLDCLYERKLTATVVAFAAGFGQRTTHMHSLWEVVRQKASSDPTPCNSYGSSGFQLSTM